LIISGSSTFLPDSPDIQDVSTLLKIIMKQDKHAFGVCFGLQLLAFLLDSKDGKLVKKGSWDKAVSIDILIDDPVFQNIGSEDVSFITQQYHNYSVPFSGKEGY
jgi:GMP synthase-like glutamine amidotransferase